MRVGRTVAGIALLAVAAILLALGTWTLLSFGTNGIRSSETRVLSGSPAGRAVVADLLSVSGGFPAAERIGTTSIAVASADGFPLFLGLAPREAVNGFLTGVAHDAATQDGTRWELRPVAGDAEPAPPTQQPLWTRQAQGSNPSVAFDDRPITLVVMNADARAGVTAALTVSYRSSAVTPIAIASVAVGAVLLAAGGYLLLRAARSPAAAVDDPPEGVAA